MNKSDAQPTPSTAMGARAQEIRISPSEMTKWVEYAKKFGVANAIAAALQECELAAYAAQPRSQSEDAVISIFRWLLGEEGEFPESLPGKRYGFRSELRKRLEEAGIGLEYEGAAQSAPPAQTPEELAKQYGVEAKHWDVTMEGAIPMGVKYETLWFAFLKAARAAQRPSAEMPMTAEARTALSRLISGEDLTVDEAALLTRLAQGAE
jgi:hypothetical protein